MSDRQKEQWQVPEGARTFTREPTSATLAVVHDPREFPGACVRTVTNGEGKVLERSYVIDTSPFGNGIWSVIRPGMVVFYPNDPSTNMLIVRSGEDTQHWYKDEALAEEIFEAEWGEYPGLYE